MARAEVAKAEMPVFALTVPLITMTSFHRMIGEHIVELDSARENAKPSTRDEYDQDCYNYILRDIHLCRGDRRKLGNATQGRRVRCRWY